MRYALVTQPDVMFDFDTGTETKHLIGCLDHSAVIDIETAYNNTRLMIMVGGGVYYNIQDNT